jgi:hypothetical protein
MTIDLKKIKETAKAVADRSGELLVTIPAGEMLELVRDAELYRAIKSMNYGTLTIDSGKRRHLMIGHWNINRENLDEAIGRYLAKEAE